MVPLLLSLSLAFASHASPRFQSGQPEVARLADRLWQAGIACTGWEPRAEPVVPIRVTSKVAVGHGEAVLALRGTRKKPVPVLTEVRILPTTTLDVLAHELAHAWAGIGDVALVEGKAEVLGQCMVAGIGEPTRRSHRRLQPIPDLRAGEWRVDPWAYLAAARLVRVLDQVVPSSVLWQQEGALSWEMVDHSLLRAGAAGQPVLDALHGGKGSLRRALRDPTGQGEVILEQEVRARLPSAVALDEPCLRGRRAACR